MSLRVTRIVVGVTRVGESQVWGHRPNTLEHWRLKEERARESGAC